MTDNGEKWTNPREKLPLAFVDSNVLFRMFAASGGTCCESEFVGPTTRAVAKRVDNPLSRGELRPDCFDFFQFLEMWIVRDTFGLQRFAGSSYHPVSHGDLVTVS